MSFSPRHVAIIMDGNGRWAQNQAQARTHGHAKGVDVVRQITEAAIEANLQYLTLYAFSTENWKRPQLEIDVLMQLLNAFLISEKDTAQKNGVRLNTIGQIERLPAKTQTLVNEFKELTCKNNKLVLTLALSYGGRDEIAHAARELAAAVAKGNLDIAAIDEAALAAKLYTCDMPDPDIMIRTGGDMRISNFLLWQLAYTELFVVDTLWPDFTREDLFEIIAQFKKRERRFGNAS